MGKENVRQLKVMHLLLCLYGNIECKYGYKGVIQYDIRDANTLLCVTVQESAIDVNIYKNKLLFDCIIFSDETEMYDSLHEMDLMQS